MWVCVFKSLISSLSFQICQNQIKRHFANNCTQKIRKKNRKRNLKSEGSVGFNQVEWAMKNADENEIEVVRRE